MIAPEERNKALEFVQEGLNAGASLKAIADLIGICLRTLWRWGLDLRA